MLIARQTRYTNTRPALLLEYYYSSTGSTDTHTDTGPADGSGSGSVRYPIAEREEETRHGLTSTEERCRSRAVSV